MLINNAITSATTSLSHKSDKLSCSPNPYATDSYCSQLDKEIKLKNEQLNEAKNNSNKSLISSLESQINDLKSNKDDCAKSHFMDQQRMSSLEAEVHDGIDVIVKLTQFSGSEDSIIELIKKEIDRLNKQQKNCETCQKSHPSADCPQHKKLEELKEKRDEISTNKDNNPRDLLDNLCTGLEKFLGYENGNYTGSGIVYSDLDRLCDGVMSFLHGVLYNIQPKLGLHKNIIDDALRLLEANEHLGKNGFNNAIGAVLQGVEKYNEGVKESNKKVSEQIHSFQRKMNELKEQVSVILPEKKAEETISPKPVEPYSSKEVRLGEENIKKKLEDCKNNAKEFNEALNIKINKDKIKESIEDLNPQLQDSVMNAVKAVQHESKRLEELSEREENELKETTDKISEVMKKLGEDVNLKIDAKVHELVEHLKGKVTEIQRQLENIGRRFRDYVNGLQQWIEKAEKVMSDAEKQVDIVLGHVNGTGSTYSQQITSTANQIGVEAMLLHGEFENLKQKYNEVFKTIKGESGDCTDNECVVKKLNDVQNNVKLPQKFDEFKKSKGYVDKIWEGLKKGLNAAWNTNGVYSKQHPGLNALKAAEFWNLRKLAGRIEGAIGDDDPDGLGYHLEKSLIYLKHADISWGNASRKLSNPELLREDVLNTLKTELGKQTSSAEVDSNFLRDLLKEAVKKGISKLHTEVSKIVNNKLKTIEQLDVTLKEKAQEAKSGIESQANIVTHNLNELCSAIRQAGDYSKQNLKKLKDELFMTYTKEAKNANESIKKILSELSDLHSELLSKPLKSAQEFVKNGAAAAEKHFVGQLKQEVDKLIQAARTDLTTHARKQYVESIKDLLTKFADKVQSELDPLPAEINYDLTIGQKGFMKKIHDYFASPMNDFFPKRVVSTEQPKTLKDFADKVNHCFNHFMLRLQDQDDYKDAHSHFKSPHESLSRLLNKLVDSKHFDHKFSDNLERLRRRLTECVPKQFGETSTVLLEALKKGMTALAKELRNAYVSTYSGVEFADQLWATKKGSEPKSELTDEGRNCAQACLTLLATLHNDFTVLLKERKTHWNKNICLLTKAGEENAFGHLLRECGFRVPSKEGIQDGELNCHEDRDSTYIYKNLLSKHNLVKQEDDDETKKENHSLVKKLFDHLHSYYEVRHLDRPSSPRAPSNIQQMLTWLTGLPHNHVYQELSVDGLSSLFEKPKGSSKDTITVSVEGGIGSGVKAAALVEDPDTLEAYPQPITATKLRNNLDNVCQYSHHVLTSFLGHGHGDGIYACEFSCNSQGLLYPSNMNTLICMLLDILQRIYEQLYFLYQMCTHDTTLSGWSDCWYGSGVGGSSWKCNSLQCGNHAGNQTHNQCGNQRANQAADQLGDQMVNQKADQRCDQHPTCGLKSPLQSFLEDGLQGFLPHNLDGNSGKLNCPVKNHFNVPCKTPMGFADITNVASHRQTGNYLRDILRDFCGKSSSLTVLLSQLRCVLPSAPKTLGDMFGFYYSLLNGWNDSRNKGRFQHRETAFEKAVQNANFKRSDTKLNVTSMFGSTNHLSGKNTPHLNGDLYSLVLCNPKTTAVDSCGPYIKPLCREISGMFAEKHAGKHLSTVVYLTESFYDLLKQLYETCNSKCGKKETKCYAKSCANGCAKRQSNGKANGIIHEASCSSIVSCKTTLPILYSNGFVFGDAAALNTMTTKRTCADFCRAIENIVKEGKALYMIVYKHIPEFLFKIREPFIWTLLALWSLSLLYLLHITVVRLDVLRIRSHLRSPASHRIAAQSLLAAARVKALANVKALKDLAERRISLGTLAGQLSGFIGGGQEVKDAILKALHSNVNQLVGLLNKSCGGEGCCKDVKNFRDGHLKKLQKTFNDIDEIEREINGLNKQKDEKSEAPGRAPEQAPEIERLNEKIKQNEEKLKEHKKLVEQQIEELNGALNQPKIKIDEYIKKLNKEIADINKNIEAHKNDPKNNAIKDADISIPYNLSSQLETEQGKLQSHKTSLGSLESLEKLITFHQSVEKNKDGECLSILNNLCTGLEKFLGYQETSKGYDGTGIVYSDLDRLCDGVMAFLGGVLSGVRNHPSVSTYYNINKTLTNILDKLHTGRDGFHDFVVSVQSMLSHYGLAVTARTNDVVDGLSALSSDLARRHKTSVDTNKSMALERQLTSWRDTVDGISTAVENIETQYINLLDKSLCDKIMHDFVRVKSVVEHMRSVSVNDDLAERARAVDHHLAKQKENIVESMNDESKKVQKSLTDGFNDVAKNIDLLNKIKKDQFRRIKEALEDAQRLVDTFDGTYKMGVLDKFKDIRTAVDTLYYNLQHKQIDLGSLVEQAQGGLETLKAKVKGSQKDSINTNWDSLGVKIKELVDVKLIGDADQGKGHLGGIVKGVKDYVNVYKDFENNFVNSWLNVIVAEEPIKGNLDYYVTQCHSYFDTRFNGDRVEDKIKILVPLIATQIHKRVKASFLPTGIVDRDLAQIKSYLDAVSEAVNPSNLSGIVEAVEGVIIPPQQTDAYKHSNMMYRNYLKKSLETMLPALYSTAKHVGEQINSFIQKSKIDNLLGEAIASVKEIGQEFENDKGEYGQHITKAIQDVSTPIATLDTVLHKSAAQTGSLRHKLDNATNGLQSVLDELEKLKKEKEQEGNIEERKQQAGNKMTQLKEEIQNRIQAIMKAVLDAEVFIQNAINTVTDAVTKWYDTVQKAVTTLQRNLLQQVHTSFNKVTTAIKTLFADQHKSDLNALKELVDAQKKIIEGIIEEDKKTAVKGLMNKLRDGDVSDSSNLLTQLMKAVGTDNSGTIKKFSKLSEAFKNYLRSLFLYIHKDVGRLFKSATTNVYSPKVQELYERVEKLLVHLNNNSVPNRVYNFDYNFSQLFDQLQSLLENFHASSSFSDVSLPLLEILKQGMTSFTGELGQAYINEYAGTERLGKLVTIEKDKEQLTNEGRNCAKVCLTLLSTLSTSLGKLRVRCKNNWQYFTIHEGTAVIVDKNKKEWQTENPLGHFFQKCGYEVSDAAGKQNGHLRNKDDCKGQKVYDLLVTESDYEHVYHKHEDSEYPLQKLYHCLQDYYAVGHIATSFATKSPCSVYEMLLWCAGLTYNSVHSALLETISEKLETPSNPLGADADGLVAFDMKDTFLNTYPHKVTYANFENLLDHICSKSASILTTVLGFGDEHTMYACDFYDNSMKFYYPKSGAECLDTLLDILRRMFPPLRFLFFQCRVGESDYGWGDCHYGKNTTPAKWQCTNHSTSESNCQPNCQANSKPNCQPTSPLMSYLNDCLPGHLPHHLSSIGCKSVCSNCPKGQPGMPCLTPLGFRGFSGTTRKGEDLSNVLRNLFGDTYLASLFCLAPKAPSTLPEHFGFALSLVSKWNESGSHLIENAFKKAIDDRSISLYENAATLTTALSNAYGSSQSSHSSDKHPTKNDEIKYGDLSSLCMATACSGQLCAPYVYTLCSDYYSYLGKSHSKLYLSWAVYSPWSLWSYLESLYNAIKDIFCQDWGCRGCLRAETCRRGEHGLTDEKTKKANCHCESMVQCRGMMPTLYKYGFTFGAPAALNAKDGKKTCSNFCTQLHNVLHSTYFDKLFTECDEFLKQIRFPFMSLLLALWSLSLLHLLHIAVVRLDVLRIRSHLRSPSSHRIAAQSLLAAARVRALASVKYFSP
ncbi:hypothetical protein, conserved [Babesia ovata]|uniref:Extracellular matrix-binding ebh n=1 Tax=Babesia ovata TaxID=189622 RepID=A0A2H6KJL8_9APIC|nr:uncharacterized protein BOVATA_046790 [Babesia ovata]GBE63186.1 hypothetical protein, conserved [Babesia ovata]